MRNRSKAIRNKIYGLLFLSSSCITFITYGLISRGEEWQGLKCPFLSVSGETGIFSGRFDKGERKHRPDGFLTNIRKKSNDGCCALKKLHTKPVFRYFIRERACSIAFRMFRIMRLRAGDSVSGSGLFRWSNVPIRSRLQRFPYAPGMFGSKRILGTGFAGEAFLFPVRF